MRKLFILFLVIAFCVSSDLSSAAFDDVGSQTAYNEAVEVVCGLGLMSAVKGSQFMPDSVVSRGEMASVLYRIFNYNHYDNTAGQWKSNFYGDKSKDLELKTPVNTKLKFTDISEENEYYTEITFAADVGIMTGKANGIFSPDEAVTSMQAVKIMLDVMEYGKVANLCGGYPSGYLAVASRLKFVSGSSSPLTRAQLAQILYKSLFIGLGQIKNITDSNSFEFTYDSDKTILGKYLNISYLSGVVTDNGITSLSGESSLGNRGIMFGADHFFSTTAQTEYVGNYIGRNVDCYYYNEDTNESNTIVYARINGKDMVTDIDARQFESYSKGTISYTENDRSKKINIPEGTSVIYNGIAIDTYTADIFDIRSGSIRLITPSGAGEVEVVILENYESWYIADVDAKNFKIYNQLRYAGRNNDLKLDVGDTDSHIQLYNSNGKSAQFKDIKVGKTIDVIHNGSYIKAYISDGMVDHFTVSEISEDGSHVVLSSKEKEKYTVSRSFEMADNKIDFLVGNTYVLYLNRFGEVTFAQTIQAGDTSYGYCMTIGHDEGLDAHSKIKLLNAKNKWEIMNFAKSVRYSNENGKETSVKNEDVQILLGEYKGVIRYSVNNEGEISYIEIPITNTACITDNKLRFLAQVTNTAWRDGGNIGEKIVMKRSVNVIVENPTKEENNEDKYSITNGSIFSDFKYYTLKAYVTKYDSPVAEIVLYETTDSAKSITVVDRSSALIKKITKGLNEEGEAATVLTVYDMPENDKHTEKKLYIKDENVLNNITSSFEDGKTYSLGTGDIIRYATDSDGLITKIILVWDKSADIHLVGTLGYYSDIALGKTNPFAFVRDGVVSTEPKMITGCNFRVLDGYVYKSINGALTVTTQNLLKNAYNADGSDSKYVTESYLMKAQKDLTVVDMSSPNIQARQGTAADIKPYDVYGKDCSQIVLLNANGIVTKMIIINGLNED